MNFKKLMIAVVAVAVIIAVWKFATRVDHSSPVAVATAFTKAMKKNDTSTASKYYVPDQADAWRTTTDEQISSMKSGAEARYFERFPDAPNFGEPVTAAGKTTIVSADKSLTLEITQINGQWYVAKF
jgi:hypothetical protein